MDQSGNDSSSARKRQKVGDVDAGYSRKGWHGSSSGLSRRDSYGSNSMGGYGYQRDLVSYEGDRRYDVAQSYSQNGWYDGYSQDDQYGEAWAGSDRAYRGYTDDDLYHNNAESAHSRSYIGGERYSYDGYYNDTDIAMADYYRTHDYTDRYAYSYSGYQDSYSDNLGGNYIGAERESMETGRFGGRSNRFGLSNPFRGGSAAASNASASAGGRYANTFKARQYSFGARKVTRSTEGVDSSKTSVVKTGTEGSSDKKEKQKEPEKPRVITDTTVKDYLALRTSMLDFHVMSALLKLSLQPDLELRKSLLKVKLAAQEQERKEQEAKLEQERKAEEEKQEKERKDREAKQEQERREQQKKLQEQREEERKLQQVQRDEERRKQQQASVDKEKKVSDNQPTTMRSVTPEISADRINTSRSSRVGTSTKIASSSKRPVSTSKDRPTRSESATKDRPVRSESITKDRPARSESASKDRPVRSASITKDRPIRLESCIPVQSASQERSVRSGSSSRHPVPAVTNGRDYTTGTSKTTTATRSGDTVASSTFLNRNERARDPRERSVPRGRVSQPAGYTGGHWDRGAREGYDYTAPFGYEGYPDSYATYDERYAYDVYGAHQGYEDRGYAYGYDDYPMQDAVYGANGYGDAYGDYGRSGGYEHPYISGGDGYYSGSRRGEDRRESALSRQSSAGAQVRGVGRSRSRSPPYWPGRATRDSSRGSSGLVAVNSAVPMRRATSASLLAKPGDDHREAGEADEDTLPSAPIMARHSSSSYGRDERIHRHTSPKSSNGSAILRTPR